MAAVTAAMLGASGFGNAGVAVIVNPASATLSEAEVANVFLGKSKSHKAVDLADWNATKEGFYSAVVKRNESQLKSYWSSLVFTGKGQPLSSVASDADVIKHVAGSADGIGYVDTASVNGSVKVLFTLP